MNPSQELQEIESLAKTLMERARSLREQMGAEEPTTEVQSLGRRLRLLRARKGWTQERLAEESGLSVNGIIKIESGSTAKPRTRTLVKLAEALYVGLDELEP